MPGYLRRLIRVVRGWIFILWIYLGAGWRFWRWRLQLQFQRSHYAESTYRRMKQTLLLIRHGQTTWNVEHRLPGQIQGIELNDEGRQQAARLADALTVLPISAIISSPLERARETAEFIAQGRGLAIQFEPGLMDVDLGRWAGQIFDELSKTDPDWKSYVKDPTVAPEGIETFPEVQQRAVSAIERWLKQDSIGAYLAFVCHADIVKLLIAHYTGLDAGRAGSLFIDNASVSLVELEDKHRPRVVAVGWNPRPGWLKPPTPDSQHAKDQEHQEGEQKE